MSDRKVTLRTTRDGHTWGTQRERSLGELGEYDTRVRSLRHGDFRRGAVEIRVSSPIKATLLGGLARVTPASH